MQSALNFLLLPVITKNIIPANYGIYSLIVMVGALASSVFFFGGSSAMSRYFFERDEVNYKKKVFSTCFLITVLGFFAQIGFGLVFGKQFSMWLFGSAEFSSYLLAILVASGLGFLFNFLLLHLRIERRSVLFSVTSILMFIFNFGITYVLLDRVRLGIAAPILGLLASNLLGFIVLVVGLRKSFLFSYNRTDLKIYLQFGIPNIVIGLLVYLLDWIDRIVLNSYALPADVGIYSFGCKIGSLVLVLYVQPFAMVWSSIRMEYARDEDASAFSALVTKVYTFIGIVLILCFSLYLKEILHAFSRNADYEKASILIPIIFFSHFVYGYMNIIDFGIYLHKRLIIYILVFFAGDVLNLCTNLFTVPLFGSIAAAYGKLGTFLICVVVIHLISNKYFPIKLDLVRIAAPLLMVLPVVEIMVQLNLSFGQQIAASSVLFVLLSSITAFLLFGDIDRAIFKAIVKGVPVTIPTK